jgi:hypothetical protein
VRDSLRVHPRTDPRVAQQVGDALLEHAGTDPPLAVLTASRLEDDRLDALQLEQPAERQPGGACADDPDLRPQDASSSASTSWAIANARFAAGTPQ